MNNNISLADEIITANAIDPDSHFHEHEVLHKLKHYLPAQAPLKDFIHHNTLHAFQHDSFFKAIDKARTIFGFSVCLPLEEYRSLHRQGRISTGVIDVTIRNTKGQQQHALWVDRMLMKSYPERKTPRVGRLRRHWKDVYKINLDDLVHPTLFRLIGSFLDQGIAMWNFPVWKTGFLASVRELEKNSFSSFFKGVRAKELLLNPAVTLKSLLKIVAGSESLYENYLFDQQFSHPGWSGMVSVIEDQPQTLLDERKITLRELIIFELLLEIDALDYALGKWLPLDQVLIQKPEPLFEEVADSEEQQVLKLWQEAFEWSYYDQVLAGLKLEKKNGSMIQSKSFQAMFCIDDRECSLRRYLENFDLQCETFGTPGFFGVEFFYQPEAGKFYTKLCPAPVTPKYLIKEEGSALRHERDAHFSKHSHSLFRGWLISYTLGFWSALKLFANIFRPSAGPASATSFRHMDEFSSLTIENKNPGHTENGLQIGFTVSEMALRVENLLKSIGMVKNFAPIVYVVGHGSSSVNNPHYSAYDCGACSGRPGSVNARVVCSMANHPEVRAILAERGIVIPSDTQFIGGLHDTTRDEVVFYDEESLSEENKARHQVNAQTFVSALHQNAKERSRRFESIDTRLSPAKIHEKVKRRSVSLFEPRPELNHATNALCIVGRRALSKGLFLDRRSFLNSFDYRIDPDGKYLYNILRAAAPVCGGINLEYFFSRVDNIQLGAGTKLPHNVMGLFGVANGADGDLRAGLPLQMIEVHDPVRLLIIVEHFPEVVLNTIRKDDATYEWFKNSWVNLVAVHPETRQSFRFNDEQFERYVPITGQLESISDVTSLIESDKENFPVYLIS